MTSSPIRTWNVAAGLASLIHQALLVTLALPPLLAPARAAQPVSIPAAPTTLTSDAERMISYRHGEHMWQTGDGATHVLINQGSLAPEGTSLQLFSSHDAGQSWVTSGWLANTDLYSTSDGVLTGNDLELVYSVTGGQIAYTLLRYDAVAGSWSTIVTETVFASPGSTAFNPALAIDGQGGRWCGFVNADNVTFATNIRMAWRGVGAPAWTDTGLVFGQTDFVVAPVERSARPVRIAGGVGMVYTVHEKIFWGTRRDNQAPTEPWTAKLLFTGTPPFDLDPFSSHFSLGADNQNNLHLATVEHGRLLYLRYANRTRTWSAARFLTQDVTAAYPQVTVAGETVAILANTQTFGGVLQSTNYGVSFTLTHLLTHDAAPPDSGLDYTSPRIESPGRSTSPIPVFQQYVDSGTQRLMFFPVPVLTRSAASGR
jgi:hypothetical protein